MIGMIWFRPNLVIYCINDYDNTYSSKKNYVTRFYVLICNGTIKIISLTNVP